MYSPKVPVVSFEADYKEIRDMLIAKKLEHIPIVANMIRQIDAALSRICKKEVESHEVS